MFWLLAIFTSYNNNWFRCGPLAIEPYFAKRSFSPNVAQRISKMVFFFILCSSHVQKYSFLLRLLLQNAISLFLWFRAFADGLVQNLHFWISGWLQIVHFVDSFVRFASPGAAFADSLVRIVRFRLQIVSPGTSETVPGLAEPRNRWSLKGFL